MQRIKMYGDKGSPCRMPQEGEKGFVRPPLKMIEWLTDEIQLMRSSIQSGGKLNAMRVDLMKSQLSLSKAFSRSILIIIQPRLPFFFLLKEAISSWAMMTLSMAFLPERKPLG